jgi:hypothetical protein
MAAKKKRGKSKTTKPSAIQIKLLAEEKKIEKEEKKIVAEEKNIVKKERKIIKLEKQLIFKIGKLKVTKQHVFDVAKVTGGAMLGTGLGWNIVGRYGDLAAQLEWFKIIGLILVSLILATVLIYHEERNVLKRKKNKPAYILSKLAIVYVISFGVVAIISYLLSPVLPNTELLIKILFIGSFSAVSGAITFNMF